MQSVLITPITVNTWLSRTSPMILDLKKCARKPSMTLCDYATARATEEFAVFDADQDCVLLRPSVALAGLEANC